MNIYFVRHGNPDYMRDCLTELGKRQAEACAEAMFDLKIDEIYSSPMGRARETALPLAEKLGMEIHIEDWAHEVNHWGFGATGKKMLSVEFEGEFLRSPEIEALGDKWYTHPRFENAEGALEMVETVQNGTDGFLERLGYRREGHRFKIISPNEKNIALFGHAGMFLIFAGQLLQLPTLTAWHSLFTFQTGITWINFQNPESGYTVPRLYFVNDTHHLRKSGISVT